MKSLNRTLSLVLVLVMVLGLIGVAGAADFKDKADIKNDEAVNTMAALNIIKGKDTGNFDPTGSVTRGEMAKMICVALNGGKEPVLGTTVTPTYSDTKGHWAAGYIEYCSNLGIVAGLGDGTFAPNASVTGSQAAKMMLVAMNYNADVFGFTGSAWETSVNVAANKAGLYKDLSIDASAALSRDNAAQLIYNGINADTMERDWTIDPATGKTTETYKLEGASIATSKFSLVTRYGELGTVKYDSVDKNYDTRFIGVQDSAGADATFAGKDIAVPADYSDYYGMQVKILYTEKADGTVDKVYGVYPYKSSVVLAGVVGQLADSNIKTQVADVNANSIKYNGTTYKFDGITTAVNGAVADTPIYSFNAGQLVAAPAAYYNLKDFFEAVAVSGSTYYPRPHFASYTFKALDTDGDGQINRIVVYPFTVHEVTYVGSEKATLQSAPLFATLGIMGLPGLTDTEINLKEDVVYDGIAEGDFVKKTADVNTVSDSDTFEKISLMTGKVAKTTDTAEGFKKAMLNGIYFVDYTNLGATGFVRNLNLGDSFEKIAQVNTFVFSAKKSASSISGDKFALLTTGIKSDDYSVPHAKLLLSDGTIKEVTTTNVVDSIPADNLVTFTVNSANDKYTLTKVDTNEAAAKTIGGYDGFNITNTFAADATNGAKISGKSIDDNAVIFAKIDGDYKVITGKQLKTYGAGVVVNESFYSTNSTTKFDTIALAHVVATNVSSGDSMYGYVLDGIDAIPDPDNSNNTLYSVKFWNGTEAVTKTAKSDTNGNFKLAKGKVFQYTMNDKDQMVIAPVTGLIVGSVDSFDSETGAIAIDSYSAKIKDETTVFYVDSDLVTASVGGRIRVAMNNATYNVLYVKGATNTDPVKFIVYDINNDMKIDAATTITAVNNTTAYIEGDNLYVGNPAGNFSAITPLVSFATGTTMTYADAAGTAKEASDAAAVGSKITFAFPNGMARTLTIAQGYVVDPATTYTDTSAVGTYTVATKLRGAAITTAQMVKPDEVVTVAINWTATDIAKTDSFAITAAGGTITTTPVTFAAGTFSAAVEKTATITTWTADTTISIVGTNA